MTSENEFTWLTGGPQGSGVDSAANIYARACAYAGYFIFGKREYHSNIKGMHSYFHVRSAVRPVRSHSERVNLLASFDAEAVLRHARSVVQTGGIIFDSQTKDTMASSVPTLDAEVKEDLDSYLSSKGYESSVSGILREAESRGVKVYPVPYMDILKEVAAEIGEPKLSRMIRMINVLSIGVSFGLLAFDFELVSKAIRSVFVEKPKIAEQNVLACKRAYDKTRSEFGDGFSRKLTRFRIEEERVVLQATQAIALGKLVGGCRFQTYYPITPAADESEYLEANELFGRESDKSSILVMQTEDEIAAINMVSGAALAGARAATATSGPGFSLMAEGLSWAGHNEVPVVVTYYQRGAPSTGLPTRHGQDDLRFALHAGHGEFARIVLASGDIEESFYDAARAFNYAERFQMPVIHLVDKALANSSVTCTLPDTSSFRIDRGALLTSAETDSVSGSQRYKRFAFTDSGISPRAPLGVSGLVFWNSGDEHNELGHISENPQNRTWMMEKRMRKLELVDREIPVEEKCNLFRRADAKVIVVSWGSTKGPILDAIDRLAQDGTAIDFLQVRLMNPLPREYISNVLRDYESRVAVEMNYSGQLAGIIREQTGIMATHYVLKYNGRPMSQDELELALERVARGEAQKKEVLTDGA